jgi:alpha-ketoglutarate-dependent sulfate ester dioxygenase
MATTLSATAPHASTGSAPLSVEPLTGVLGAALSGVALNGDLEDATIDAIKAALHEHRVIFFRDQHHLDDEAQIAFGARLGTLTAANPLTKGLGGADHTVAVDSNHIRANAWHTDATFLDRPPAYSILRAVKLPALGGDTIWADTVAAYQRLGPALRQAIGSLRARHDSTYDYSVHTLDEKGGFFQSHHYAGITNTEIFATEHPIVRVHPDTGEHSLLLGMFVRQVEGLRRAESDALIRLLQDQIERPDNTVRWHWAPGDVAIWDNQATQHYAVSDYEEHRLMRRVTVAGKIPVGLDGRPSRALSGDASSYSPA